MAFVIDRHQPEIVGAERVQHEKRMTRRGVRHRFSATAFCVPRPLDVQQREAAFLTYREAGDGIVTSVGSEQKATIRRENDTARTLEVVRPVNVVDGAQFPRTGAARQNTFHLGDRAVRRPMKVYDGVPGLVRLHIQMSATRMRRTHRFRHPRLRKARGLLCSSSFLHTAGDGSHSCRARYHLEKRSTI